MKLENGYETKTTFWEDFSIADAFGADAIKDTFDRSFKNWKNNYEFCFGDFDLTYEFECDVDLTQQFIKDVLATPECPVSSSNY